MNKTINILKNTITDKIDLALFILILALLNMHIITGKSAAGLVFYPSAIESGRWWTILTHPFIHVTWYHFLLDAGAFLLLRVRFCFYMPGWKIRKFWAGSFTFCVAARGVSWPACSLLPRSTVRGFAEYQVSPMA